MIIKVFSIYDSNAEVFLPPFYFQNKGEAIRVFSDTVQDSSTQLCKHPEDFTLFMLGDFDNSNAKYTSLQTPVSLGLALDFVKAADIGGSVVPLDKSLSN